MMGQARKMGGHGADDDGVVTQARPLAVELTAAAAGFSLWAYLFCLRSYPNGIFWSRYSDLVLCIIRYSYKTSFQESGH